MQIQVFRAVELEGCGTVDLAHGNAQVPLVGVDAVQAVVGDCPMFCTSEELV